MGNRIYPALAYITDITNAQLAVATFSADHDFTPGENVSFRVTPAYGMFEINNKVGRILSTTSDTITVDIDTTTWTPFVIPGSTIGTTPPTCLPSSSGLLPNYYPPTINLEDSFDNIRT